MNPRVPHVVRVAAYARRSPGERSGRSLPSTRAQLDIIGRHFEHLTDATGNAYTIVREFVDERKSGKNLDRPDIKSLVEFARAGGCDIVASYRLDRITRSLLDFATLDDVFTQANVALVSVRENLDTSTPIGRAMRNIILVFAQLERETLVERVKDKHRAMQARGLWTGGAVPYGYRRIGKGMLEVDPERAAILMRILTWYADEGLSVLAVKDRLITDGVPPPTESVGWRHQAIARIIRHPCHRGRYKFGASDVEWPFPVIPPAVLVERVDERLSATKQRRGRNGIAHTFQGIVRCGRCGRLMIRSTTYHHATPHVYLRCSANAQNCLDGSVERCPGVHARLDFFDHVERAILACIRGCQPTTREWNPPPDVGPLVADIEERRRRAHVSYNASGSPMSDEEYLATLRECDAALSALAPPAQPISPDVFLGLADVWDTLPVGRKNEVMRLLVDAAMLHADRVDVIFSDVPWEGLHTGISVIRPLGEWHPM